MRDATGLALGSGRVRRHARALYGLFAMLALMPAHATTWYVQVGGAGLDFSPKVVQIAPGDTVAFLNMGGVHNVVADDGAYRCAFGCDGDGQGGSGAPSGLIWSVRVTYPAAGTYGYFCETHGSPGIGMYGTVVVQAPTPPRAPEEIPSGGRYTAIVLVAALWLLGVVRLRRQKV